MEIGIRALEARDWPQVRAIYLSGIATGNATFQTEAPQWADWDSGHLADCRFVAEAEGRVLGWIALSAVSSRPVYRGVTEVSVYVDTEHAGRGVGRRLMSHLVRASEELGIWTLQAGIFPENAASLALHRTHGFREVGCREKLGLLDGRWRDVMLLERRSLQPA
ncbi:GNAT family N-acetyltransferase [Niveibacterium terrae]|uniref:GNAT family N-acetyltransferase n=1 Tax=Niveibacterium terrae TaxID=3373598 RepID=UPI003A9111A7